MWAFRTMIVADAVVETCRSLAMSLAGEGQKLWTTPLSADGAEPATHWISSGLIEQQFADLLPLADTGYPGNPALLTELSQGAVTEEQVIAIFDLCDVTLDEPQAALNRLGLQMVVPHEITHG